ncbi:MAG: hypothetical protein EA424_17910, partial [Planctomycetaceae bacterium]
MTTWILLFANLLAGQADAAELELETRRLVRQLDGPSLAQREAAEQTLLEFGPPVLDLLPPVTRTTSAEVRVRLDRIRNRLQQQAAAQTTQATHINLQGDMPLQSALAALAEQSGNAILDYRDQFGQTATNPTVTLDFQDKPFWQALDQVLDQAGLTIYNFSGQPDTLAIVARGDGERARADRGAYSGLFRFEGVSLVARRDLRDPRGDSLRLVVEVAWEPRVRPIVLQLSLDTLQAVDEDDQPIAIEAAGTQLEVPTEASVPAVEIQIPLSLPDRSTRQIGLLQGQMSALIPGRVQEFVFENLRDAKAVEQRVAGVTVTVDQVRKTLDLDEIRMRVRFDRADIALESHRNWVYQNEAYLLDPDGQRVDYARMEVTMQRQDEVGVAFLFDRPEGLEGCRFV